MVKKKVKQAAAGVVLIIDIIGLLFVFGVFQKAFYPDRFETFTVIAALNTLAYYIGNLIWLRHHNSLFIPGWKFSAFVDSTIIAVYGLVYMRTYYQQQFMKTGLLFLWVFLPLCMIIDWLANEKRHMHYRFILIALFLPVLYVLLALILGHFGHGLGIDGVNWPYPFLNVDQLGVTLVIESCIVRFLFWLVYSWLLVKIDRRAKRKKKY